MSNILINKMKENGFTPNMVFGKLFVSGIKTSGSHDTTLRRFQQHLQQVTTRLEIEPNFIKFNLMANPKTKSALLSTDCHTTAFIKCADDISTNMLLQFIEDEDRVFDGVRFKLRPNGPTIDLEWPDYESFHMVSMKRLQLADRIQCTVGYCEDVGEFYLRMVHDDMEVEARFQQLTQQMQHFYNHNFDYMLYPGPNDVVVARTDDGIWRRAQVLQVQQDQVKVFCVDYGATEWVHALRIRTMQHQFVRFEGDTFKCKLHGLGYRNSLQATKYLEQMVKALRQPYFRWFQLKSLVSIKWCCIRWMVNSSQQTR
jgi:hypothetical protein